MVNNANSSRTKISSLGIHNSHQSNDDSIIVSEINFSDELSAVSIVLPVHNMQKVIQNNVRLLSKNAKLSHELIIILDDCEDSSKNEILEYVLSTKKSKNLIRVVLVESEVSLFETTSDAIGFSLAKSQWLLEVQADMQIYQKSWDSILINHLIANDDVICVSGRGCHDWGKENIEKKNYMDLKWLFSSIYLRLVSVFGVNTRSTFIFKNTTEFGRCGRRINAFLGNHKSRKLYLGHTIMRGPLAISKKKYDLIGGLNTKEFFLGGDDHELMYRAWTFQKWRCGYTPLKFKSPTRDGATRKPKTLEEQHEFRKIASNYKSSFEIKNNSPVPEKEVRKLRKFNGKSNQIKDVPKS